MLVNTFHALLVSQFTGLYIALSDKIRFAFSAPPLVHDFSYHFFPCVNKALPHERFAFNKQCSLYFLY